ncbi:MAG: hypothetical protein FJ363_02665 [Gemmatimonadetes bacterium]|nr:hypothetical protein [Gemmatimonadota bacterium]
MSREASHYHPDDRLLVVIGTASGASVALGALASASGTEGASWLMVLVQATVAAQGGAALLWLLRWALRWLVGRVTSSHAVLDAYRRGDTATYAVFLLSLSTALGVRLVAPLVGLLLALFAVAQWRVVQGALAARAASAADVARTSRDVGRGLGMLAAAALGAAATLQGFAWTRMLTTPVGGADGIVALAVAALLVGAGTGALVGRWMRGALGAGRRAASVALPLAAAAWSAASLVVVPAAAAAAARAPDASAALIGLAVLALPMAALGASVALIGGVLSTVREGDALFAEAIALVGASAASVLAVDVLLAFVGVRGLVWTATALLGAAALAVVAALLRLAKPNELSPLAPAATRGALTTRAAATTAALAGALLSSYGLVWARILGGASGYRADAVDHALAAVLAGTGLGLLASGALQRRLDAGPVRLAALLIASGGVLSYLALPLGAGMLDAYPTLGRVVLAAAAAGTAFVVAASIPAFAAGGMARDAGMMGATLLGAAAGAMGTGWLLLDAESVEHTALFLAITAVGIAQGLWLAAPERRRRAGVTVFSLAALAALAGHRSFYAGVLEQLHFGPKAAERQYVTVVQGRDGVVGTTAEGHAYADGLYLGTYRVDVTGSRGLADGALVVPALHRAPRRVLLLGLGTGTTAWSLARLPGLETLTIVEPNARVLDALWRHRDVATVLEHPKVRLHVADPRRWMQRHADGRYDVIVADGPWHWRSGATRLVSAEFQQLVKQRLAPGGMAYLDASGSLDVLYTASGVWRHVVRVGARVAASDETLDRTPAERQAALLGLGGDDGEPWVRGPDAASTSAQALADVSGDLAPALRRANDLWNITDDNLAAEFKATGAGAWWRTLPSRVWRPDRAWPTVLF